MILLDTHAWGWLIDAPDRIPAQTRESIEDEDLIAVSTISCWEVAMLCSRNRIDLSLPLDSWVRESEAAPGFVFVPLSVDAARLAGDERFGWPHADPSDRMIVATAIDLDIPLVTADRAIQSIPDFTTLW